MEREHCNLKDAMLPFDSSNGIKGTTSAMEWEFVVSPDTSSSAQNKYAERGGDFRQLHPNWCRRPKPLSIMEEKMHLKNEELERAGQTKLVIEELIGGILYTSPCYEKYNAVLRFSAAKNLDGKVKIWYASFEEVPYLQKKCGWLDLGEWVACEDEEGVRWEWHNNYATTIHSINSIVVKCSRLTTIQPLYRGWTGATLPERFFVEDEMGVKGGVE